jgi:hypothetical protein
MLEFAGVMNDVDPASILTYQIEATPRTINGASVLEPNTDGENMQAILAMFRGETSLADAPVQQFEETSTAAPRGSTTAPAPAESAEATTSSTSTSTTTPATVAPESPETSVAGAGPQENQVGIVPPRDVTC